MVFGLFSKERALQRAIKKATNKLTQSQERWAAMEKLREVGTDEALYALLRRFSFASLKTIEDQEEKDWVVHTMIAKGEACLPTLRRYMKNAVSIAYPLKILESIVGPEKALEAIDEILAIEEPGYTRDPTKRTQVIDWLAEYKAASHDEVVARVGPYLADFDEGVRFASAEAVSLRPSELASEPMVKALINPEEESKRLKVRIIEIMSEQELSLCGEKKKVQPILEELAPEYRIQKEKLFKRKKARK